MSSSLSSCRSIMGSSRQSVLPKFLYGAGRVGGSSETGGAPCSQARSNAISPLEEAPRPQTSDSDCVLLGTNSVLVKPPLNSDSNCVVLDTKTTPGSTGAVSFRTVNSLVASQLYLATRKRRRSYEGNWHFQDSWVAKLRWAESVLGGQWICDPS